MISALMTYEEMCASHRWDVPRQYNIAADVCDKHPRELDVPTRLGDETKWAVDAARKGAGLSLR